MRKAWNRISEEKVKEMKKLSEEGMQMKDISKKIGVCRNTVMNKFNELGIPKEIRLKNRIQNKCEKCGRLVGNSEHKCPEASPLKGLTKENSEIIRKSQEKRLVTWNKLSQEGKITPWAKGLTKETDSRVKKISDKLKGREIIWGDKISEANLGIKRPKLSETMKRLYAEGKMISPTQGKVHLAREKNPMWKGGIAFLPYTKEFNKLFKKEIKERDGCCLLCNISMEDLRLLKRTICIHHIDYNKLNSLTQNCCSLCNNCHSKTNVNRSHWTKFFQSILSERYGYKYSEDGKIILEVKDEK